MDESVLRYIMPNIYKLFLNITIQHVRHHFNNSLCSTFLEFEQDIDDIFGEINAYIPQFTTRSDTHTKHEKRWIFGAAFTIIPSLFALLKLNFDSPQSQSWFESRFPFYNTNSISSIRDLAFHAFRHRFLNF